MMGDSGVLRASLSLWHVWSMLFGLLFLTFIQPATAGEVRRAGGIDLEVCFRAERLHQKCSYSNDEESIDSDSVVGESLSWIARAMNSGVFDIAPSASYCGVVKSNQESFQDLLKRAIDTAKTQKLSSCQKACLATCISSRFLEYSSAGIRRWITEECAISTGKGACGQFSAVAKTIMQKLGLEARLSSGRVVDLLAQDSSEFHTQVDVKIGKEWLRMEPQRDSCEFRPSFLSAQRLTAQELYKLPKTPKNLEEEREGFRRVLQQNYQKIDRILEELSQKICSKGSESAIHDFIKVNRKYSEIIRSICLSTDSETRRGIVESLVVFKVDDWSRFIEALYNHQETESLGTEVSALGVQIQTLDRQIVKLRREIQSLDDVRTQMYLRQKNLNIN